MATPSYNDANFRLMFPAFADATAFPMARLQGYWTMGTAYISTSNCAWSPAQLQLGLDLMAAHLAQLFTNLNSQAAGSSQPAGLLTSATEGSVSIGMTPPPFGTSMFKFWLSSTPYGMELAALLGVLAAGGAYIGGLPERQAYRKVAGIWR